MLPPEDPSAKLAIIKIIFAFHKTTLVKNANNQLELCSLYDNYRSLVFSLPIMFLSSLFSAKGEQLRSTRLPQLSPLSRYLGSFAFETTRFVGLCLNITPFSFYQSNKFRRWAGGVINICPVSVIRYDIEFPRLTGLFEEDGSLERRTTLLPLLVGWLCYADLLTTWKYYQKRS